MSNLDKIKTAKLRKMAEDQEIEGCEDMEREELLKALKPKDEPKEGEEEKEEKDENPKEEVDPLEDMTVSQLKKDTKEKGIDVKGLRKKDDLIEAIKAGGIKDEKPEEAPEEGSEETPEETPGLGAGITEGHVPVGSKAERMREHLAKQPKVRILIPFEGKERPGITVPVTLNGYRQNIAKGVYVEVAKQIADEIMKSQKQTVEALNNPLNLDNPEHPKKKSGEGVGSLDA